MAIVEKQKQSIIAERDEPVRLRQNAGRAWERGRGGRRARGSERAAVEQVKVGEGRNEPRESVKAVLVGKKRLHAGDHMARQQHCRTKLVKRRPAAPRVVDKQSARARRHLRARRSKPAKQALRPRVRELESWPGTGSCEGTSSPASSKHHGGRRAGRAPEAHGGATGAN